MRSTARLMWLLGGTFLTVDAVYVTSHLLEHQFELIGMITMGLSSLLFFFLAFYFDRVVKAGGSVPWPEDREYAEIDDGDPELGHFSPWSWWPVTLGASVAIVFLGLAIGFWIAAIGAVLVIVALIGWMFEYYRGYFAR